MTRIRNVLTRHIGPAGETPQHFCLLSLRPYLSFLVEAAIANWGAPGATKGVFLHAHAGQSSDKLNIFTHLPIPQHLAYFPMEYYSRHILRSPYTASNRNSNKTQVFQPFLRPQKGSAFDVDSLRQATGPSPQEMPRWDSDLPTPKRSS